MAITLVQSKQAIATSGSTLTVNFTSNVIAGNCIIYSVTGFNGPFSTSFVSDGGSDTFTGYSHGSTFVGYNCGFALNSAGGFKNVIFTGNIGQTNRTSGVNIYEFSGIATASAIDGHNYNGSITTTVNGDLIFVQGSNEAVSSAAPPTSTGSWVSLLSSTATDTLDAGNNAYGEQDAYLIQGSAGAINLQTAPWTSSPTVGGGFALKAAAATTVLRELCLLGAGQ